MRACSSAQLMPLFIFHSSQKDRNTLPKKGLRYVGVQIKLHLKRFPFLKLLCLSRDFGFATEGKVGIPSFRFL